MDSITSFLKKFTALATPHKELREVCARECSRILNRPIDISSVRFDNGVIYLDLPPLLRGEVALHKREVLDTLNAVSEKTVTDIR